jgi:opacity protein-like surface antigen
MAISIPLLAHEAHGQGTQYGMLNIGNGYVGVSGGVIIPNKLHGTFSGAIAGGGDLSFKTGPVGTGFVGYHVDDYLSGELEAGYARFDEDNFSGTLNGVSGSASINGKLNTIIGFGNVIVTPFGRSGFAPYVGGGPGVAHFDEKVNSIGGIAVNTSSKETDFAANVIAGFEATVASRWSIGARYRFVWANTSSSTTSGGVTTKQDDFTAHVITANATFHF